MRIFNLDSPLMVFLGKVADLMIVNVLTLLFCIPIITVGPAFTAAHYVCLKIVRDEECYIVRSYFKSFKQNFKQATIIWLLLLLAALIMVGDFYIITKSGLEFNKILKAIIIVVGVLILMISVYVFPVLAKFDNTVLTTIKNALFMSILQLPKTALMLVLYVAPAILAIFVYQAVPVVMLLGVAVPVYCSAFLYNGFFKKIEGRITEELEAEAGPVEDDPDRIFSDKLDEALIEQNMEK